MYIKLACLIGLSVLIVTPVHVESGAGTSSGTPIGESAAGAGRADNDSGAVGLGRGHLEDDEDEALGAESTNSTGSRRSNANQRDRSSSERRGGSSGARQNPAIDPTRGF